MHGRSDCRCRIAGAELHTVVRTGHIHLVNIFRIPEKCIIAQFIPDVNCYQHDAGHPDSQSRYIDKAVYFVPLYISPGSFKIIFKHDLSGLTIVRDKRMPLFIPKTMPVFKIFIIMEL